MSMVQQSSKYDPEIFSGDLKGQNNFHSKMLPAFSPGQVAQLVRASSLYAKVAGSISGRGTHKKQPMNA